MAQAQIFRVVKDTNFTVMGNWHLRDTNLSLKAKGLLSIILSLPDEWDFSVGGLCSVTGEGEWSLKKALDELKKSGYLVINKIMPSKDNGGRLQYEYVIYEKSQKQELENKGLNTTVLKQQPCIQPLENLPHNKYTNKLNKELNKEISKDDEEKEKLNKKKKFVKPTVEEIRAYCDEKGYTLDAEKFFDYYESVGWKRGKSPVKDWKATVRTWARNAKEWKSEKARSSEIYKPEETEDITYKKGFEFWKQYLGVGLKETREQVEACKALMDDLGEEGLERLVVALRMRSQHSFLTRDILGVKVFVGLRENAVVVQNFYDKHWREWKRWAENEKLGKKRWEL